MDNYGDFALHTTKPSRKRRSNLNRRPPYESESPQEYRDPISPSLIPSGHVSDAQGEGNIVPQAKIWSKGQNSNQCISRASYTNLVDAETVHKSNDEESNDLKESFEGNSAAASWKDDSKMSETLIGGHHSGKPGSASDVIESRTKFNKVKLKVGGVTHTIHTRSSSDDSSVARTSATKSSSPDEAHPPHMLSFQVFVVLD